MTAKLKRNVRGIWGVITLVVVVAALVLPVRAVEFDSDTHEGSVQGLWWQGYSYLWLDFDGGGWVYDGGSRTTKSSSVDYIWVRGRGQEYCAGAVTDDDWDSQLWGTTSIVYQVTGSGYSSAGSCSWYVWYPCKVFESDGDHRADEGGYYSTGDTSAEHVEPSTEC